MINIPTCYLIRVFFVTIFSLEEGHDFLLVLRTVRNCELTRKRRKKVVVTAFLRRDFARLFHANRLDFSYDRFTPISFACHLAIW